MRLLRFGVHKAFESQDDTWTVINSFFLERGLVSQQLDSFNTFMGRTIHEQIADQSNRGIEVESKAQVYYNLNRVSGQYRTADDNDNEKLKVSVTIGNIRASRPTVTTTASDQVSTLWPREARLRNLTYAASIFVEMTQTTERSTRYGSEEPQKTSKTMKYRLCMVRL